MLPAGDPPDSASLGSAPRFFFEKRRLREANVLQKHNESFGSNTFRTIIAETLIEARG